MYMEFTMPNRDEFLESLQWGGSIDGKKAFLLAKQDTAEGTFRVILVPMNGSGIRVVVEKKIGESLLGEPIYRLWDDVSNFERLLADTWLVKTLFVLLAEARNLKVEG